MSRLVALVLAAALVPWPAAASAPLVPRAGAQHPCSVDTTALGVVLLTNHRPDAMLSHIPHLESQHPTHSSVSSVDADAAIALWNSLPPDELLAALRIAESDEHTIQTLITEGLCHEQFGNITEFIARISDVFANHNSRARAHNMLARLVRGHDLLRATIGPRPKSEEKYYAPSLGVVVTVLSKRKANDPFLGAHEVWIVKRPDGRHTPINLATDILRRVSDAPAQVPSKTHLRHRRIPVNGRSQKQSPRAEKPPRPSGKPRTATQEFGVERTETENATQYTIADHRMRNGSKKASTLVIQAKTETRTITVTARGDWNIVVAKIATSLITQHLQALAHPFQTVADIPFIQIIFTYPAQLRAVSQWIAALGSQFRIVSAVRSTLAAMRTSTGTLEWEHILNVEA